MIDNETYSFSCPFCRKAETTWRVTERGGFFVAKAECCGREVFANGEIELEGKLRSLDAGYRRQFPSELGYKQVPRKED